MGLFTRLTGLFSSSAPKVTSSGVREWEGKSAETEEDAAGNAGSRFVYSNGSGVRQEQLNSVDLDEDEKEEVDLTPRSKSKLNISQESTRSNGRRRSGQLEDETTDSNSKAIQSISRSQSSWKPIPMAAFSQSPPRSQTKMLSTPHRKQQSEVEEDSADEEPKKLTPKRKRKSLGKRRLYSKAELKAVEHSSYDGKGVEELENISSQTKLEKKTKVSRRKREQQRVQKRNQSHSEALGFLDDEAQSEDEIEFTPSNRSGKQSRESDGRQNHGLAGEIEGEDSQEDQLEEENVTQSESDSDVHEEAKSDHNAIAHLLNSALRKGMSAAATKESPFKSQIRPKPSHSLAKTPILPSSTRSRKSTPSRASSISRPALTPSRSRQSHVSAPDLAKSILPPKSAVASSSTPSFTVKPVPLASPAALQKLSGMTPQVIIKAHPRPSLLSIVHNPDTDPGTSAVDGSSDEETTASINEEFGAREKSSGKALGKRKAVESPDIIHIAKRFQGVKQEKEWAPLGDDILRFGVGGANVPQSAAAESPKSTSNPTSTRILPPASLFRFVNSHSRRSSQSPAPASRAFSSSIISTQQQQVTPSHRPIVPQRNRSISTASVLARQSTLSSFVSQNGTATHSKRKNILENFADISQRSSISQASHAQEDVEMVDDDSLVPDSLVPLDDDEPNRSYSSASSHSVPLPSERIALERRGIEINSPPRSNIRRKRRLPSSENESMETPTTTKAPIRTPIRPPNYLPTTSQESVNFQVTNSPQLRANPKLLVHSLDDDEIETISEAVDNYRRHQDLSLFALNALVQQSGREGGDAVKAFWDEICSQVPDIPPRKVKNFCRRKYHNYLRGSWSDEQDRELKEAFEQYPNKWAIISEMINRFPEDARCRWRDYVSCGDAMKRDVWDLEEEEKLRKAYESCLGRVRAEKSRSTDRNFKAAPEESLVDWNMVSVAMGHTRSRLQCFQKWSSIKGREAEENDHCLAPLADTVWRINNAVTEASAFNTYDKIRILRALRDCGAASERKIPWKTLAKDLNMTGEKSMAMKILLRNLRINVPGHRRMDFQGIVSIILDEFEAAAPNEPKGFDTVDSVVGRGLDSRKKSDGRSIGDSSCKKQLKTYSMRKSRHVTVHSEEDSGVETVVRKKSSKKVRDRMRRSDEYLSQETSQSGVGDDGEDLAEELRTTWSQPSATPKAKQPIFKPKISQRPRQRQASSNAEDEQLVSSISDAEDKHASMNDADPMKVDVAGQSQPESSSDSSGDDEPQSDRMSDVDEDENSRSVDGFIDMEAVGSESESQGSVRDFINDSERDARTIDEASPQLEFDDESVRGRNHEQSDVESEHSHDSQADAASTQEDNADAYSDEEETSNLISNSRFHQKEAEERPIGSVVEGPEMATKDNVEVKVEDFSDSEDMSNIMDSQEASQDERRLSNQFIDEEASETSTESDDVTESEASEDAQANGFHRQESNLVDREEQPQVKYRSPSPQQLSGESTASSDNGDRDAVDNASHGKGGVKPILSSPSLSPEIRESSLGQQYANDFPALASPRDIKPRQLNIGFSLSDSNSDSDSDLDSDSGVEEEGRGYLRPKANGKAYGEGYLDDDEEHHITMKGWTPQPENGQYTGNEDEVTSNLDDDVNGDQSSHHSFPKADVKYPILPEHLDAEDEDEPKDKSQYDQEDQEADEDLPQSKTNGNRAWNYARWVRERNFENGESDDSDSDASSIPAVAVPRMPRQESVEL